MKRSTRSLSLPVVGAIVLVLAGTGSSLSSVTAHARELATTTTTSVVAPLPTHTIGVGNTGTVPASTTTSTTLFVPVCGNPTLDAIVSASDALYTLRTAVGSELCELCVCDVDDSGAVTATDALAVLRYAVGSIEMLDCAPCAPDPECGDGVINQASEDCDGDDDDACPGLCNPDCTCAPDPECGDGMVNQAGEECDGEDDDACRGLCRGDCTCPPPVCGNDVTERAEVCDGSDLAGQSCTTLGFIGGTLACAQSCRGVDSTACDLPIELPPDPEDVAPEIDPTVATDVGSSTEFLYTGDNPVQYGVAPGTIRRESAAVLRGSVTRHDGSALAAVEIRVLGHPEFGATQTRSDGRFDMAVNGGGPLTLDYRKSGFLPAQRQVTVPWRDYVEAPPIVLIELDTQVSTIDLTAADPMQVARASPVSDDDGTRQSTLLFAQGTQAEMVLADGSRQALSSLDVRATEYTVGDSGPQAMPAELPANSGYTYAFELSVDEAMAAGATDVEFSEPVAYYVENFLDAEVGSSVPVGYYDRARGTWVPSESGLVIKVLSVGGGTAELDTDGDDLADDPAALAALGITDAELERLAGLYAAGQTLWRVAVSHFSSWDCNWGFGPPDDAVFPNQKDPTAGNTTGQSCPEDGSIIECLNRVLGESVPIVGTPFTLNYRSNRVPGRRSNALDIALSGATVPASLIGIELEIAVAGQEHRHSLSREHDCLQQPPTLAPAGGTPGSVAARADGPERAKTTIDLTDQSYHFEWDGKDAYGRAVQGRQATTVRIGYKYCGVYQQTYRFAYSSGLPVTGSRTRQELVLWQEWQGSLGSWDARAQGLGGWTLSAYHAYDPFSEVLLLGTGDRRDAQSIKAVIKTVAGDPTSAARWREGVPATSVPLAVVAVAVIPDGGFYVAENLRVRRVAPDGLIWSFAGNGTGQHSGDGGPATQAGIDPIKDIALGPDGSLYISTWNRSVADEYSNRVRRVGPDGIITTVAGGEGRDYSGDGGPATEAKFWEIAGLDVGPDGSIYVADVKGHAIRRIAPDGTISTFVGRGYCQIYNQQYCLPGDGGDGGPANEALLESPEDVAVGPDGSVYLTDTLNNRVRRVGNDGIITTVAGDGTWTNESGDGGPATSAQTYRPSGVALASDGTLYIAERARQLIRRVWTDGIITTAVGQPYNGGFSPDGTPAADANLFYPDHIDVGERGLYIPGLGRIQTVEPGLPSFGADRVIASEDGAQLYRFAESGRHLETLDALTGSLEYRFEYDAGGLLRQIVDADGNVTTIERDADGNPTAIVGAYGARTVIGVSADGYVTSLTDPANQSTSFAYAAGGLLSGMTDAGDHEWSFAYDGVGRLIRDDDPAGGYQTFVESDMTDGYEVARTTALGRTTTYGVEDLSTEEERLTTTVPSGVAVETLIGAGGSRTKTSPDGTVTTWRLGPDPLFGMQAPNIASLESITPGGLDLQVQTFHDATLADSFDLLSMQTRTDNVSLNGRWYEKVFDAASGQATVTTPAGRMAVTSYDDRGRVIARQVGAFPPVVYAYDSRGRLESLRREADGKIRELVFGYDTKGRLATISDPLLRMTRFEHDDAGNLTKLTLPDGGEVDYDYDAVGNLTSLAPPGGSAHTFAYTPLRRGKTYTAPDVGADSHTTTHDYDADRGVTRVSRPDGLEMELEYDSAGRLSTLTLPSGSIGYAYDATTGALDSIATAEVTVSYMVDGFLPTQAAWSAAITGTVDISYDDNLRVISRSVNSEHRVDFAYDDDDLLTTAGALALTRSAENGIVTATSIAKVADARVYNAFGDIENYSASYEGLEVFSAQYETDELGRLVEKIESVGATTHTYTYDYDAAGRLTEVKKDGAIAASYDYDANGNRIAVTIDGTTLNGTYDAQDRLLQLGTASYAYTANGELLTESAGGQTTTYDYDVLGNLLGVILPGGTTIEYVVDGRGRRVGKKANGILAQGLLYKDRLNPIAELDGDGAVVARFIYGEAANVPAYMEKGGNTYRILSDHLGSPRLVIDTATGAIEQELDYDAFGRVLLDTNPGFQPFGFAGGLYDSDTGLVRFGFRDYHAVIGRWTAKDPLAFGGGDTNLYAYVFNDPVNSVDASGLALCGLQSFVLPALTGSAGTSGMGLLPLPAIFGGGGAGIAATWSAASAVVGSGIAGFMFGTCLMDLTEAVTGYDPSNILCDVLNCDDPCGIQSPFIAAGVSVVGLSAGMLALPALPGTALLASLVL